MKKIINEGLATIKIIPGKVKKSDEVFYNPAMKINRDISVLAVRAFQKMTARSLRVMDVMAATGIRGIRYALEVNNIHEIIFNDLNPKAIELIKENVKLNNLDIPYKIYQKDAACIMHEYRFLGDVVDVDPFGTPAPYLDAAARCVSNKGLLMITFTDTAVLSATYPNVALRRYGVKISKGYRPHQELAMRVALASIAKSLSRFDKGMIPLLSIVYKHFVRVIVAIDKHKNAATKVYENIGSKSYEIKGKKLIAENVWVGKVGDVKFVKEMLKLSNSDYAEANKVLNILKEEYKYRNYYDIPFISKMINKRVKGLKEINKKIKVAKAHFQKDFVIATNASLQTILKILND